MTTTSESRQHGQPRHREVLPTTTARLAVPATRTVCTRSGSRYRIDGRRVRKLPRTLADPPARADFVLIDIRGDRLRYTDGTRLYVSSPIVTTRADAA